MIDRRTDIIYIKPSLISLTSSKRSSDYMVKTIINNLNKVAKDLIKMWCENYTNITSEINKYHLKKSVCKIVNCLEDTVSIDQILKCKYVQL